MSREQAPDLCRAFGSALLSPPGGSCCRLPVACLLLCSSPGACLCPSPLLSSCLALVYLSFALIAPPPPPSHPAALCYALLADLALNFLRSLISKQVWLGTWVARRWPDSCAVPRQAAPLLDACAGTPLSPTWKPSPFTTCVIPHCPRPQWQEAGGWAGSSWAAATAQRASDGVAALARLHDSYLLCRDPVVSLKLAAGLWGLAVLGSYLRWGWRVVQGLWWEGAGMKEGCRTMPACGASRCWALP